MVTTTGRWLAAAGVVLVAGGWWADYPELVAFGLCALTALLLAWAWMAVRPEMTAGRELDPVRVGEGERCHGWITLTNVGRRRSPPIVAVEHLGAQSIVLDAPSLPAGKSWRTPYTVPTTRRGVYRVGPLTIGHSDPFRLMRVSRSYTQPATLWVHPRLHRVNPLPTGRSQDMDGPTSASAPRGGVAFYGLREYVPGDDLRLVHWKSTARAGTLMVRLNVVPQEPQMLIVLDTSTPAYTGEFFEEAVRVAASLCRSACDRHFPLQLRTTSGQGIDIQRDQDSSLAVLDLLAAVQATAEDPGLVALPRLARRDRGVSLGVVTGRPDPDGLRALSAVRTHFAMVSLITIGDPLTAPRLPIRGGFSLDVASAEAFASAWNAKVPR